MEDKMFLNEYGRNNENDFGMTYMNLEAISLRRIDALESIRNECRPIAYDESSNYSSQSCAKNCSVPMQDNWGEIEVSDGNRLVSSLQWQSNLQEVQPNTVFEYNESSGANIEMQRSEQCDSVHISTVGECIRAACDCLIEMNSQNNDLFLEKFDSPSDHSTLAELHLFEPNAEPSIVQRKHFNANGGMNRENKCESIELKNEIFNLDSIKSGLKFSQYNIHPDTTTEEYKFLSEADNSSFDKSYCRKCSKFFTRNHAFLNHKCVNTSEKCFQYGVSQRKDNQPGYKRLNTKQKKVQCDVCEKEFSNTKDLVRHRRTHTGEKPFQCNVCEKSFSQLFTLNVHIRTHTGEKPFQCNVCKKRFSQSSSRNVHMRTQHLNQHILVPTGKKLL